MRSRSFTSEILKTYSSLHAHLLRQYSQNFFPPNREERLRKREGRYPEEHNFSISRKRKNLENIQQESTDNIFIEKYPSRYAVLLN
jgi:hypothetical protein